MKIPHNIVTLLVLTLIALGACLGQGAKSASLKTVKDAGSQAKLDWIQRIDKVHEIGCEDWITAAWATMLIKQGIIPAKDAPAVAGAILKMLEKPDPKKLGFRYQRFYETHWWLIRELGKATSGNVKMARVQPSAIQMLFVRSHLMKRMCQIHDLQEAMLRLAQQHAATIMPGYTHQRHAQPTTFGHYVLSGADAIQRSAETLEDGYRLMSLNELGCGALAGTSWPIDRNLVSAYLGMEGLLENTNDAVSYTDGYLVVVCGLTNVCNVLSRMGLEMSFWSGVEYGFLEMGTHGVSFLMPQKSDNPTSLEHIRLLAGQVIGHLNSVAIAGLREPHGDVIGMLHLADPTLAALEASERPVAIMQKEMETVKVHPERMLAVIRDSYIASTELANQMVRDYGLDYRTAHQIIHKFVLASEEQNIPATDARARRCLTLRPKRCSARSWG